jgi:simple sugar transport system substrate-binding protein
MLAKRMWIVGTIFIITALVLSACATPTAAPTAAPVVTEAPVVATEAPTEAPTAAPLPVFGMVLIGSAADGGWSQAHYDAGLYVEEKIPGVKLTYIDLAVIKTGTTFAQLADELVAQGANVILFNSDDMKADSTQFAKDNPEIKVIMASGDQQWKEGKDFVELANMVNVMGKMEYGKMIAGCAAALTTQTGAIGYLGPLTNDETRRLASSVYLGAKYCWTTYLGKPAEDLKFKVTWIGGWVNIPGVTSDPTQVADDFYNSGYDVVVSGIDTTEALVQADKANAAGKQVWAIQYDYKGACAAAPKSCLGVPYFNWGPFYVKYLNQVIDGTFGSTFEWFGPDWTNINNPDTSMIGFVKGEGLSAENGTKVDQFIAELAGGLNLWKGPMNLQDGTVYLADGVAATDFEIWYLPQLLQGMEGLSQ